MSTIDGSFHDPRQKLKSVDVCTYMLQHHHSIDKELVVEERIGIPKEFLTNKENNLLPKTEQESQKRKGENCDVCNRI